MKITEKLWQPQLFEKKKRQKWKVSPEFVGGSSILNLHMGGSSTLSLLVGGSSIEKQSGSSN